MKMAFVMDPMDTVKTEKDTSWSLMCAASDLGHEIFHVVQENLSLNQGQLYGDCQQLLIKNPSEFSTASFCSINMTEMDLVFVRKDPPFDRRYFYTTLLLDFLPESTRVINRPQSLRDWNEKLSALYFQQYCPPTLISQSRDEIEAAVEQFDDAILKPLDGFGGRGITRVNFRQKKLLSKTIETLTNHGSHKIVVNPYLKEAELGDKRILLVNGLPIGGILRKADKLGELNNLDQGGQATACELTKKDREICETLKPYLLSMGLYFVGIDLLGPWLTEINVTSPTGLQELIRFSGVNHHHNIIKGLSC